MSVVDTFLKKMRMVSDDDYEDYDDYDDYADGRDENDEDIISSKRVKNKQKFRDEEYDDFDDFDDQPKKSPVKSVRASEKPAKTQKPSGGYGQSYSGGAANLRTVRKEDSMNNVCMIMPKGFEDANLIADKLTEGCGVVMNLEGIDMSAAQRIIDFASGACYAVNGNLQKISKKIFMAVPGDVNLSGDFDDLIDDMVGLNSVSMK